MSEAPKGWKSVTLGDITIEQNERVGRRANAVVLSSTKHRGLVPSNEYFQGRSIYSDDLSNYKVVRPGWFAYATNHLSEGSIGLWGRPDFACSSPIYTVFSCTEDVEPSYLAHVLKTPELMRAYAVHEQASVDRRGAIHYRDFSQISVRIPPICEQRRIVEIIATIDRAISTRLAVLGKLVATKSAQVQQIAAGSKWPFERLDDHLETAPRNGYSPKEVPEWTGATVLGLGCLTREGFRPVQIKNIPLDPRNQSARLLDGDVLMSRANTRELVGLVGRYRDVGSACIYPDLMMRLRPANSCRPEFLEIVLSLPSVRREIQALAQGTSESMVKITGEVVKNLQVPIPNLVEQDRTIDLLHANEKNLSAIRNELEKVRAMRSGVQADLIGGRVRIPHNDAALAGE